MIYFILFFVSSFILHPSSLYSAAPPSKLNYQGVLQQNGTPVNGNKTLNFKIYDALTGGTLLWDSGALTNVTVTNGLFAVKLNVSPDVFASTNTAYMEISVDGTPLAPREEIVSAAYALHARSLDGGQIRLFNSGAPVALPLSPPSLGFGSLYYDTVGNVVRVHRADTDRWELLSGAGGGGSPWTEDPTPNVVYLETLGRNVSVGDTVADQKLTVKGNISLTGVLIASATSGGAHVLGGGNVNITGGMVRAQSSAVSFPDLAAPGVEIFYDSTVGRIQAFERTGGGAATPKPLYLRGDPLVLNQFPQNVGIGTDTPGAKLHVVGGDVLIGSPAIHDTSGSEDLLVAGNLVVDGRIIQHTGAESSFDSLQIGAGANKSTFTTTGSLNLANNAGLTLSGTTGNITTASSVTASAFFGNGSGLTNVAGTDSSRVARAGDGMTGPLTMLSGSSITVSGHIKSQYGILTSTVLFSGQTSDPASSEGMVYYNSSSKRIKYHDGSVWSD
ncbi:MAG: hypothetical protein HY400_03405 [Elusimicrobia bacterium]|nr:hypothetical protein [Elusimicrobiota bacterium]